MKYPGGPSKELAASTIRLMDLRLRPFDLDDERSARDAHAAMAGEQFPFLLDVHPNEPWSAYLHRLDEIRHGRSLPPRWVPSAFLAADVGGELVGRVSIRYELNDFLENFGATSVMPSSEGTAGADTPPRFSAKR